MSTGRAVKRRRVAKKSDKDPILHNIQKLEKKPERLSKTPDGVIVLFAPNAGGSLPSDGSLSPVVLLEEALTRVVPNVIVAIAHGIRGAGGCSEKALGQYHSFVRGILKDHPGDWPVIMVGASFGCRLSVHYHAAIVESRVQRASIGDVCGSKYRISKETAPTKWKSKPSDHGAIIDRVVGMIFFGYPLYHSKYDRIQPLGHLREASVVEFIVGTEDETGMGGNVTGSRPSKSRENMQIFSLARKNMMCKSILCRIKGGKHNPIDIKPKSTHAVIRSKLVQHIEEVTRLLVTRDTEAISKLQKDFQLQH
eukprot:m.719930 g.719930  ORF g.719930 m.719930 type:complete len:309 (+) comp23002_c0_seq19:51-977(+)